MQLGLAPSKINETKPTSAALNVMKRCGGPNCQSMAITESFLSWK